jgi:hypothetical protein
LLAGDAAESMIITATYPSELEKELSQRMRSSALSAKWERGKNVSATEGLNFSVTEAGELKLARRMLNSLLYTKSGEFPSRAVENPIFIVAGSVSQLEIFDRAKFARERIVQTKGITDLEIQKTTKVTIDALPGYEIFAVGKDVESGTPMFVYQVMLFEARAYFIMQGLVTRSSEEQVAPVFKAMARSFKRGK